MARQVRLAGALLALAAAVAAEVAVLRLGAPWDGGAGRILAWYTVSAAVFVAGAAVVRGLPQRQALALALGGCALLQAVAVAYPPTTTDDFWRYLWDGKVQSAGIDPYRYAPLDPALRDLRDPELFPPDTRSAEEAAAAVAQGRTDACTTRGVPHDCTMINRPGVRTIYPPVAQAAFTGLHYVSPPEHRVHAAQAAAGALAVAATAALAWALRRYGRDPRAAVWWAWCPVVWLECGNNAHVDVLAIGLLIGTFGLLARAGPPRTARLAAAGALFGAAVAVKLVPALVAPAFAVRRGYVVAAAAVGVFALGYVPHVAAVGTGVLGYLPGYLDEEGYSGRERFGVLRLVVPGEYAPAVAVLAGAALAVLVWRRAGGRASAGDALLLAGAAFVLVGPSQPWYGLLLVALAALADRPEWLAVAAAAYPVYLAAELGVGNGVMQQRAYLPAALLVLAVVTLRHRACERDAMTLGHRACERDAMTLRHLRAAESDGAMTEAPRSLPWSRRADRVSS